MGEALLRTNASTECGLHTLLVCVKIERNETTHDSSKVKTLDIIVPVPAHILPIRAKELLGALIDFRKRYKTSTELRCAIFLRRADLLVGLLRTLGLRNLVKLLSDRRRPTYKQVLIQTNT